MITFIYCYQKVRVCEGCYTTLQKPNSGTKRSEGPNDLPAEYLNSSLAQQSQVSVRTISIKHFFAELFAIGCILFLTIFNFICKDTGSKNRSRIERRRGIAISFGT